MKQTFLIAKYWLLGSVRRQLVVGMVVVVSTLLAVFIWEVTREQQNLMRELKVEHAEGLAQNVASSSAVWVASRDFAGLQNIINGLSKYPDLTHAIVLDLNNQILAHSELSYRGQYLLDMPTQPKLTILQLDQDHIDLANPIVLSGQHIGWVRIGLSQAADLQRFEQIKLSAFAFLLIAVTLAALLATVAARYLTRRLYAIQTVADKVKRGKRSLRVKLGGFDEAAQLAKRFNIMLDTLVKRENELVESHHALEQSEKRLNQIMAVNHEGIWDWDIAADKVIHNQSWADVIGLDDGLLEHPAQVFFDAVHPDDRDRVSRAVKECFKSKGHYRMEYRFVQKNTGNEVWVQDRGDVVERDAEGNPLKMVGGFYEVTERKQAEEAIENLAFYDPLTQLPNRRLLQDRLQQEMAVTKRSKRVCALMFIDLDDFKTLNDTLGHDTGDKLLRQVAARLRECVREFDTVARIGGDEFVLILPDLDHDWKDAATHAELVAQKVLRILNKPYLLDSIPYHNTPSIGVKLFSGHQETLEELLKHADLAMYQAKAKGRNTIRFYDTTMQEVVNAKSVMEANMRQAITEQQFVLFYQPQINSNGQIIGAEALVRWLHPEQGLIAPNEFIPLAEENGFILPIGRWVLQTACEQLVKWSRQADTAQMVIAVNVSARQFHQIDLVEEVESIIRQTGANPQLLKLELTESLLIKDVEDVVDKMQALKKLGINFSLDDFGTGYSSLSYLKRLPLDQLKIDQTFVRDIIEDSNDAAIARAVIALAESMEFNVIAEGVETAEQHQMLIDMGCRVFQGYLFGRPVPIKEFFTQNTVPD
ncbi:EAL domain-containing protein [Hydrogenovibrio sp. 3SP14C1]|uniref:EAL domain-containing protein n=1 Tax=Hydrogenovibrio sp. 3SP14C1 TaxID=3038774 RepID=UPI002416AEAC|nr:EAL domain-containing protein [Hydrogenovibrio sp. 3SP14C1]MDG4812782.1 EAL domain-containing protein [Hydrogenovibrio sp. 3SP14C1]